MSSNIPPGRLLDLSGEIDRAMATDPSEWDVYRLRILCDTFEIFEGDSPRINWLRGRIKTLFFIENLNQLAVSALEDVLKGMAEVREKMAFLEHCQNRALKSLDIFFTNLSAAIQKNDHSEAQRAYRDCQKALVMLQGMGLNKEVIETYYEKLNPFSYFDS